MLRLERLIVQADLAERAGTKILHEDVALLDDSIEQRAAVGLLEIERDAFLVPIDAEEVGAFARVSGEPIARILRDGLQKGRPPAAGVVASAGLFDLDDARAHVGEKHRAIRSGQHARQIADDDSVERSHNGRMIIVYAGSA